MDNNIFLNFVPYYIDFKLSEIANLILVSKTTMKNILNPMFWEIVRDKSSIIQKFINYVLNNKVTIYPYNKIIEFHVLEKYGLFPYYLDNLITFEEERFGEETERIYHASLENIIHGFYSKFTSYRTLYLHLDYWNMYEKNTFKKSYKKLCLFNKTSNDENDNHLIANIHGIDTIYSNQKLSLDIVPKTVKTIFTFDINNKTIQHLKDFDLDKLFILYYHNIENINIFSFLQSNITHLYIKHHSFNENQLHELSGLQNLKMTSIIINFKIRNNMTLSIRTETLCLEINVEYVNSNISIILPNVRILHIGGTEALLWLSNFVLISTSVTAVYFNETHIEKCLMYLPQCQILTTPIILNHLYINAPLQSLIFKYINFNFIYKNHHDTNNDGCNIVLFNVQLDVLDLSIFTHKITSLSLSKKLQVKFPSQSFVPSIIYIDQPYDNEKFILPKNID